MAWSFNATGSKGQCLAALAASTPPEESAARDQYEHMRTVLRAELERYEDDSRGMSVAASGQAPGEDGGDRSFSIWISGKAASRRAPAKIEPAPKPAITETTEPPLTTRRGR